MKLFLFLFFLNCFTLCVNKLYEDIRSLYKRHWHGRWHGGRGYRPYPYGPGSWYLNGPKRWYPYVVGNANIVQIKSCINNNDCPQGYTCFRNRCYLNEIFDRAIIRYNPYFYYRRSY